MKKLLFACLMLIVITMYSLTLALGEINEYIGSTAYTNCKANLRSEASTKSKRVAVLSTGTKVVIVDVIESNDDVWCLIEVDDPDVSGYILLSLLDIVSNQSKGSSAVVNTENSNITLVGEEYYYQKRVQLLPEEQHAPTFSAAELSKYRTLSVGDSGEDVLRLKDRMYELGYFSKKTSYNIYTAVTADYVKNFQEKNELIVDGVASPEMQALFYSEYAVGASDKLSSSTVPDLEILSGQLVSYGTTGCAFQLQLKNNTNKSIDAYTIIAVPYSSYGTAMGLSESFSGQMDLAYSNERYTIKAGKTLSEISKNYYNLISEEDYYGGVLVAVEFYHTTDGVTAMALSNQSVWYGIGKGVIEGAQSPDKGSGCVFPTEEEREEESMWRLGITLFYVPSVFQNYYNVPEGMYTTEIVPDSIADNSGLMVGDIVISIGDVLITSDNSVIAAKGRIDDGESAEVLFWREGSFYTTFIHRN